MHCNEIRELISCMLDNELSAEESALVTEHVAGCPECMRVFEAFHALSVTLEELEEVPVGFTADVMDRVYAAAEAPKKRKPKILRYVAMAACFALVLMAGSGAVSTYRSGSSRQANDTAAHMPNATQYTEKIDGTVQTADTEDDTTPPPVSEFSLAEHGKNDIDMQADPANGSGLTGVSIVSSDEPLDGGEVTADSPATTPAPQPEVLTTADLLAVAEDAEPGLYPETADYTVTLITENGDVEISVWVRDGKVYCMDLAANTAWIAVGTPEQLAELLGPIPTPEITPQPTAEPAVSPAQ